MKKHNISSILFLVVLVVSICGFVWIKAYTEYIQFLEIGYKYASIFFTNIRAHLYCGGICFLLVFVFFSINNFAIRRVSYKENMDLSIVKKPSRVILLTVIMSLLIGNFVSERIYDHFLTFTNVTWFGQADPVFGWDLGYYIFTRPFFMEVVNSVKGLLLFNIAYTAVIYILFQLRGGASEFKAITKNKGIIIHCLINIMLYVIMTALTFKFNIEDLLYGSFCNVTGAGSAALKIWYPYYKIAPFMLIIIVPLSIYFLYKTKYKESLISVGSFLGLWAIVWIISIMYQSIIIDSDESVKENKYLTHNIQMTRMAYGIDKVNEYQYDVDNELTYKDIKFNVDVLSNIDITSSYENLEQIKKEQALANYSTFYDSDIICYDVNGIKKLVSIAARELNDDVIKNNSDAYANNIFKYTHGTGVIMSDTNKFDEYGQNIFLVKDIPVLSDFGITQVQRPRIYYGEGDNSTVIVKTNYAEVDYENTDAQKKYEYNGFGGIQMDFLNRCILSLKEKNFRILMSDQTSIYSKALVNRNIRERVGKIAPFFMYDSDPYPVITDDGSIKWILDAYAVTDRYPYSTKLGSINYIAPVVKVVVDAYDGNVNFYVTDWENEFVQTYNKIYPTLFEKNALPEDLQRYMRYPQDLFKIQSEMFKRYHVTEPNNFYDNRDIWDGDKQSTGQLISPYYTLFKNDGKVQNSLISMYSMHRENSINAYLVAGSDIENYGKLDLYRVNKTSEDKTYNVSAVEGIIKADSVVSNTINELSQNGANVRLGEIKAIPIKKSFIHIQPVYVISGKDITPQLKSIIVVHDGKCVIADSLSNALRDMFEEDKKGDGQTSGLDNEVEPTLNEVFINAIRLYDRVKEYSKANDWENYGRAMKEFDIVMNQIKQKQQEHIISESFVGPIYRGE